ncbi:MAG TPA: pol polyprotein [Fimbriimonas sp.]|nr:pol polyprotein [Fimbriimonas sp.]
MFEDGSEETVSVLVDSGCAVEMVDRDWINEIGLSSSCEPLPVPLDMIQMSGDVISGAITHSVTLGFRIGEQPFEEKFLVTTLGTHAVALGLTWLRKHNPDINWETEEIVELRTGPVKDYIIKSGNVHTKKVSPAPPVLAFGPSTNPEAAFSAGGVFAAIEAEEARRDLLTARFSSVLSARSACQHRLDDLEDSRIAARAVISRVRGLTGNDEGWLETIPNEYRAFAYSVFSDESAKILPPLRPNYDCKILIKEGEKLSTCKIYDMSKEQLEILKALLDEELGKGFIRPSTSPASSPVFFVTDPGSDSRGRRQQRLVVDYRSLNSKIVLDEYPIPLIRTVMERLPRAKYFTKFDVRSGFANIRINPGDEWKTAFKTFYGLYEYTVMPMGLATAPSVFQRFINSVLAPFLDLFCFAYVDDIIIFSETLDEHRSHVTKVLSVLEKNQLHLKPSKCVWHVDEISFLGFTAVAGKGIRMSDDKLEAMRSWEAPSSLRDLRSFLGLTNYYHDFVPHYSDITSCLTDLTKKDTPFDWTPRHQAAFDRLKSALRNDVFLAAYDWEKPTTLETDASDAAFAGVISQPDENGRLRPVIMFSHKFKENERNWPIHDKELYAIVYAFNRYRHFLAAPRSPVSVFTDHRNLAKFMTTTTLTGRLARWWEQLSGSNFQIQYRPGNENTVADALSRFGDDGYDESQHALLPRVRFSPKALADLDALAISSRSSKIKSDPGLPVGHVTSRSSPEFRSPADINAFWERGQAMSEKLWSLEGCRRSGDRRGLGYQG